MASSKAWIFSLTLLLGIAGWSITQTAWPQGSATDELAVDTALGLQEEGGMTLFNLLATGGWVMVVLLFLSILMVALVIYFFMTLSEKKLVPKDMVVQIRHFLRDERYDDIARLCRRSKGMFSKVIIAGLTRSITDAGAVSAAMESVGRREADHLMRRIRFLSEIATVAPMLGLLGTVLGMISAFNLIAFDISVVKPVAMAGAVAQALVTTAAGLIVAIPSMGFFFYFRARLQSLVGRVEEVAIEISEQIGAQNRE